MSIGILGNKIGMTQIFTEDGLAVPVTVVEAGPCYITQIKNIEKEGYNAVQIGFDTGKKHLTKPELGHLKNVDNRLLSHLQEYRVPHTDEYQVNDVINVEKFEIGQLVNVTGKSIGKGFSGNQKRHNFKRGPMSHGSKNHRAPGSIGPGTTPGRVFPGKKMPGQYGNKQITVSKLKIVGIDTDRNLLILKGSIPGKPGNLVSITVSK